MGYKDLPSWQKKKYDELIPSERGEFTARYNPRARHIYF